jgi:antitoxin HicB
MAVSAGDAPQARRTHVVRMSSSITYPVVIEEQDGEFVTYVPALDFASTHGDTRDEALERTREMIVGYLEFAKKEGLEVPLPASYTEVAEITVRRAP